MSERQPGERIDYNGRVRRVPPPSRGRPGERGDQVLMAVISLSHNNDDEASRQTEKRRARARRTSAKVASCQLRLASATPGKCHVGWFTLRQVHLCEWPTRDLCRRSASRFRRAKSFPLSGRPRHRRAAPQRPRGGARPGAPCRRSLLECAQKHTLYCKNAIKQ